MKNSENQKIMDKKLSTAGAVAVVQCKNPSEAVDMAKKLLSSGVKAMEIAYRDLNHFEIADGCISEIRKKVPDMIVGAATVINKKIASRAVKAGAQFILSAGFNPQTVKFCISKKIPVYPGICTPSEIEACLNYGLTVLKFFPVENCGSVEMIKALYGPYPQVKFIVSGGLNETNAETYRQLPNVLAVSGSWLSKI